MPPDIHPSSISPSSGRSSSDFSARHFAQDKSRQRVYGIRHTRDDGTKEYFFLLVDPLKEKAFTKAIRGNAPFDLAHFGAIVGHGPGEPSERLKERISASYHVIFN